MNEADQFRKLAAKAYNAKFDPIYKEQVKPVIDKAASEGLFSVRLSVDRDMKRYLEDKGFNVYTYVRGGDMWIEWDKGGAIAIGSNASCSATPKLSFF